MREIAQQTEVENGMLKILMEGLRSTLAWKVQGSDFSRKLHTLRFIAKSFQWHLEHLFSLEEYDGYMDLVNKRAPQLTRTVDALKLEHEGFRSSIRWIVHGLDQISPTEQAKFATFCDELLDLLEKLAEHTRKETDLFQEVFEREGGGEG